MALDNFGQSLAGGHSQHGPANRRRAEKAGFGLGED